ncbi:MAG TPA: hypothetical protein VNJ01_18180 [Bacteriovoracaceae bacterium]|nr:hypothetical protein [Bacteriovoracaceae bacterium]
MSVYGPGGNLTEAAFSGPAQGFSVDADPGSSYAEAKRQVESLLASGGCPATLVRFPIVLGIDDFTQRLIYHVERIKKGEGIYFPDPAAKLSFIDSADAAEALYQLGSLPPAGPVNVASEEPVPLGELVQFIEKQVGKKFSPSSSTEDWSPFGVDGDWYLNVGKAKRLGLTCRPVWDWLGPLVAELSKDPTRRF